MKKCLVFLLFSILLIFININPASAQGFPIDAVSLLTPQATDGTLLVLATSTRTLLFVNLETSVTVAGQALLYCGTVSAPNRIIDTHYPSTNISLPMNYLCYDKPIYQNFSGLGVGGGHSFITYVNYNIASSTPTSTISTTSMNTNIENISYIATTTTLSNGVQFTQAQYNIPYFLYISIFLVTVLSIATGVIYIFLRQKNGT